MISLLKDRLALAIAARPGLSQAGLARAVGIATSSVSNWFTGDTKSLKGVNLLRAAEYLHVNSHWLGTGRGQMDQTQEDPADLAFLRPIAIWDDPSDLNPEQFVLLPKLEYRLSCGNGGPDDAIIEDTDKALVFTAAWAHAEGWSPRTHFTMRAHGDSMEPTIQHGAPVVIDCSESGQTVRSGRIYAIKIDGEPLLKRLDKLPGGRLRVRADNQSPMYAPYDVPESELEVIGRAVWTPTRL